MIPNQFLGGASRGTVIRVRVECYAGHRGEETPRCFYFDERAIPVSEVMDQWLAPDHRYFKIKGGDGATYILRHDTAADVWELVMFERGMREQAAPGEKQG